MTFQYDTAKEVAAIVRQTLPNAKTVLGGYHATLAYAEIATDGKAHVFDYLVRGEGEMVLNALVSGLKKGPGWEHDIPGLSYRVGSTFVHNERGPLLDLSTLSPPARTARVSNSFHYFGMPFDVVETSRGCTKSCRFCSIHEMYGDSHRTYLISRVTSDIRSAVAAGAQGIFFVDDNINLNVDRLDQLCDAIIDANLQHLDYICQADVAGFEHATLLPEKMHRAGFKGVFLGIESVCEGDRKFLGKGNTLERTRRVIIDLRNNHIAVCGGFILGNPEDTEETIRSTFRTARGLQLDHAIMWCLTPYPGTAIRADLLTEGLVTNRTHYRSYNGFICNVRTRTLDTPRLAKVIAKEALKFYFHPLFLFHGRVWGRYRSSVLPYLQSSLEYLTKGLSNRLYESRHRM